LAAFPSRTGNVRSVVKVASLLLILSVSAALARPVSTVPTPLPEIRDPCAGFTESTDYVSQTLIMDLEGREVDLRVPKQFMEDPWDRKDGFADTAQLFRVEIGTFLPVSRSETGKRNKKDIWNWMTFLIGDKLPLEDIAVLSAESFSSVQNGNRARDLRGYVLLSGPFGLSEIRSDAKQPTPFFRTNTYLAHDADGALIAVLSCSAEGSVLSPGCQHWFRSAGMDVELNYRRTELPNWQALQEDVAKFLTCVTATVP